MKVDNETNVGSNLTLKNTKILFMNRKYHQDAFLPRSKGLDHAESTSTRFIVASGGVLSVGYGHGGPGVCLGDGKTEAEGVPSQRGRGGALLRRMPPYLT